jgi:hypothetical protein
MKKRTDMMKYKVTFLAGKDIGLKIQNEKLVEINYG